jgi:hypothetical protein
MKLGQNPPRNKNPLHSLAVTKARPFKADPKVPEQCFPLMKLLPELRIRIYECVFADFKSSLTPPSLSTIQNLDDYLRTRLRGFLALLHASRALRSEGVEVYCRMAMTDLLALKKTVQDIYTLIGILSEVCNWMLLMDMHAQQLAMGKLGILLRVIKYVVNDGHGKQGWSFAALNTAMAAEEANMMGSG